jgi:TetR/AcrR family transcriptional repressor of nem operon
MMPIILNEDDGHHLHCQAAFEGKCMGSSQEQKEKTYQRLLAIAAKVFRRKGLDGLSVPQLMKAAGLTHGGFYRHFASRDDLVTGALDRAFDDARVDLFEELKPDSKGSLLPGFVDAYLSTLHRDNPGRGCVLASLSADIQHSNKEARGVYTKRFKRYVEEIKELMHDEAGSERAMALLSLLAGSVIISRALSDDTLSKSVLDAAHKLARDAIKTER